MKKIQLSVLCWCCCLVMSFAQNNERLFTVSAMEHNFSLPSTNLFKSELNPGLSIGTERAFKSGLKHDWALRFNLSYFYHVNLEHNISLDAAIVYKYNLTNRLHAQADFGLGYAHTFYPGILYEQTEDGSFVEKDQIGNAHAIANMGLEVGYNLRKSSENPLILFTKYQMMIETPFAVTVPVIPHTLLHLGVKFSL